MLVGVPADHVLVARERLGGEHPHRLFGGPHIRAPLKRDDNVRRGPRSAVPWLLPLIHVGLGLVDRPPLAQLVLHLLAPVPQVFDRGLGRLEGFGVAWHLDDRRLIPQPRERRLDRLPTAPPTRPRRAGRYAPSIQLQETHAVPSMQRTTAMSLATARAVTSVWSRTARVGRR